MYPPRTAAETREDLPVLRPRMNPAKRRALELGALALLAVVLVELRWWDDVRQVRQNIDRPEKVTAVADGGDLAGTSWTLAEKRVAALQTSKEKVAYRLVAVPSDQAAAESLSGIDYRVRGSSQWSASGEIRAEPAPGSPATIIVTAILPRGRSGTAVLELLPPSSATVPGPVPVLRFGR